MEMTVTPTFSLIGTAIRSNMYRDFYDSFAKTRMSFEVVFAGNAAPTEAMPDNFKYVYTEVKPAQCIEIAARHATGQYLLPMTDDIRVTRKFLDRAYNYVSREPDRYLFCFRYKLKGKIEEPLYYDRRIPLAPIMGLSGIYDRKLWAELGGLDRRFIFSLVDADMQLRFKEAGKSLFIIPDCILEELKKDDNIDLDAITNSSGRSILHSLWVKEDRSKIGWEKLAENRRSGRYVVSRTRLQPVESYVDEGLLLSSQGPSGKWK